MKSVPKIATNSGKGQPAAERVWRGLAELAANPLKKQPAGDPLMRWRCRKPALSSGAEIPC
jgi:hypothetical protein